MADFVPTSFMNNPCTSPYYVKSSHTNFKISSLSGEARDFCTPLNLYRPTSVPFMIKFTLALEKMITMKNARAFEFSVK